MNPEMPTPEPSDIESSTKSERELGIDSVRERYVAQAARERSWLDFPEAYAGAHSQTRIHAKQVEALANRAEEIFEFEQSLAGKSPDELLTEVGRIQAEMDAQRKLQRDIRAMAFEHQVRADDTGKTADKEIVSSLDKGEDNAVQQQNFLYELKQIVQARLPKEKKL